MILVLSLLLTVFMRLCGRPVLLLFGASSGTIGYALDYMNIYCLGTVLIQLTLGLNAFITAEGFTKISMLNVAVGAVCNVVLDYVIINLLHWGVEGQLTIPYCPRSFCPLRGRLSSVSAQHPKAAVKEYCFSPGFAAALHPPGDQSCPDAADGKYGSHFL